MKTKLSELSIADLVGLRNYFFDQSILYQTNGEVKFEKEYYDKFIAVAKELQKRIENIELL